MLKEPCKKAYDMCHEFYKEVKEFYKDVYDDVHGGGEEAAQWMAGSSVATMRKSGVPDKHNILSRFGSVLGRSTALGVGTSLLMFGAFLLPITPVFLVGALATGLTLANVSAAIICTPILLLTSTFGFTMVAGFGKGMCDSSVKHNGLFTQEKTACKSFTTEPTIMTSAAERVAMTKKIAFTSSTPNTHQFLVEQNVLSRLFENSGQHAHPKSQTTPTTERHYKIAQGHGK